MAIHETDENFFDFKCPWCGNTVSFLDSQVSSVQDCPRCYATLIVPELGREYGNELPIPINTPRIILRRLRLEDREDLLELMADEDSFQYIDWEQRKEEEEVERWLQADNAVRLTQSEGELCLGIESRDFPRLVGYINIYYADAANRQGGFTMMVKPNSRRLGYAKEALRGAFVFGFEGINLHRFVVGLDSRNIAACGMLDKVGMRREGEFVKDRCVKGEWVNTVWFALLKEESQKWKSEPRKTQAL